MMIDRRTFLMGSFGSLAMGSLPEDPIAKTRFGTLRGFTTNGTKVFLGIPFAKVPAGLLRFRAPEPPTPWTGERSARRFASRASQGREGSEDCLYLNIWTPSVPGTYPVLFWIHGGGNVGGGTPDQSGESFARQGVVVVTVAYRLGTFGFLELGEFLGEEYADSGANGIRDLVAALKWVRENIAAFSGDADRVTVAGHSAGAKNVCALLAAPSAEGLFARAIVMSGGGQTIHQRASARLATEGLFEHLGIAQDPSRIKTISQSRIMAGQERLLASYPHNFPFRPYVGGRVLPKRPVDLISGRVPILIGTTRDESISFLAKEDVEKPIRSRELANLPVDALRPVVERYQKVLAKESELTRRVRLVTAEEYWIPSIRVAEAQVRKRGLVWMYRFEHTVQDPTSFHHDFSPHGFDVGFAWNHHPGWNLHETWTGFIREGTLPWEPYDLSQRATRVYGWDGAYRRESDPEGAERSIWEGLL